MVVFLASSLLVEGCASENSGQQGVTPSPSAENLTARGLADKLGCDNPRPAEGAGDEAVSPVDSVQCNVGDAHFIIRTYASRADAEAVRNALRGDGYRTVGDAWIVTVNTLESARHAQEKLGGEVITLTDAPS